MKQKFTSLDLHAAITEIKPLLQHARLVKIYDHPESFPHPCPSCFLLKFASKEHKVSIVIEAGIRLHMTTSRIDHGNVMPGGFASKLRKHLSDKRLISIDQVGFDRIGCLTFSGDGQNSNYYLYVELFAAVHCLY